VRGEMLLQAVLKVLVLRGEAGAATIAGAGGALGALVCKVIRDELLRGADGVALADDDLCKVELLLGALEGEEDLGVADGDAVVGEPALDLGMKLEEAHAIGDGGAALADLCAISSWRRPNSLARREKAWASSMGLRSSRWRFSMRASSRLPDRRRRGRLRGIEQADFLCGAPAAFAGDQLKFVEALADDEWLDDAVLADGIDEFAKFFAAEFGAGWRAWSDVLELDLLDALAQLGIGVGRRRVD